MLDAATEPTTSFPPPSLGATTSGAPPGNMSLAEKRSEVWAPSLVPPPLGDGPQEVTG